MPAGRNGLAWAGAGDDTSRCADHIPARCVSDGETRFTASLIQMTQFGATPTLSGRLPHARKLRALTIDFPACAVGRSAGRPAETEPERTTYEFCALYVSAITHTHTRIHARSHTHTHTLACARTQRDDAL